MVTVGAHLSAARELCGSDQLGMAVLHGIKQICSGNVNVIQSCLKPTAPSHSTGHTDGAILLAVELGSRNRKGIKVAAENADLCGKNMRCVHFSEIYTECCNMRNMWQSH